MNVHRVGDSALSVDVDGSDMAQRVRARLLLARLPGVRELVPGRRSLLLIADPLVLDLEMLAAKLPGWDFPSLDPQQRREIEIQVTYDGPDLNSTARQTGLERDEIIDRHTSGTYTVAFLGFAPGFPYLVGLDPRLHVPRLDTPRTRVAAGSVAIADDMTVIYPHTTPGGWRILGHTDASLFNPHRRPFALLAPGDRVHFVQHS